jgi:ADP-heptose:LPS heptosyltransferase
MGWACIARYGGIGDNLIASSVLAPLRAKYGHVEVISQSPQSCVFENNPHIDKLSVHKPGDIPCPDLDTWHAWHRIRAKEYDFFEHLSHTCEADLAMMRGQPDFWRNQDYRREKCDEGYVAHVARICRVPASECRPDFFPTDEETALAQQTRGEQIGTGPCVGWVLSGSRIDKVHPASTLAVARIIRECDATVVLFGGPGKDCELGNQVIANVKRQNGSITGVIGAADATLNNQRWPIRRLLTQLRHCDVVVTPDTGPAWSVAHHEVPKVVLLGHASPRNITERWRNTTTLHADPAAVPCWPCHRLHDTLDTCAPDESGQAALCMSSISVEAIVYAVWQWLKNRNSACERIAGAFTSDELLNQRAQANIVPLRESA